MNNNIEMLKYLNALSKTYNAGDNPAFVFLFNSPPSSGKDSICEFLSTYAEFEHIEFKAKLFQLVKTIYSVPDEVWDVLYTRDNKEKPTPWLNGKSPRQAMIYVSETVIKPNFGDDYFGDALVRKIANTPDRLLFCCSDSGFLSELTPVVNRYGVENVKLVRIHRPGYTFEMYGDSRTYIKDIELPRGMSSYDIDNDGESVEPFLHDATKLIIDLIEDQCEKTS